MSILNTTKERQIFTASAPSANDRCWFYVDKAKKVMCGLKINHTEPCRPKPRVELWKRHPKPSGEPVTIFRVCMDGKQPVEFPYFWVAVSFAVYAFKHPNVMAERL